MSTRVAFYNENSARNALVLEINGVKFYFSYKTCVGLEWPTTKRKRVTIDGIETTQETYGNERIVLRNYWSVTTGKHLNWIDGGDKRSRVDQEDFDLYMKEAMKAARIKELPEINI